MRNTEKVDFVLGLHETFSNLMPLDLKLLRAHQKSETADGYNSGVDFAKEMIERALASVFDILDKDIDENEFSFNSKLAPREISVNLPNGEHLKIVEVPSGSFILGSREKNERPLTRVSVPSFFITTELITIGQWNSVCSLKKFRENTPIIPRDGNKSEPITSISYQEALEFCNRLSKYTGLAFKLPSESMWEYCCKEALKEYELPFHNKVFKALKSMVGGLKEMTEDVYRKNHLANEKNGEAVKETV